MELVSIESEEENAAIVEGISIYMTVLENVAAFRWRQR